MSKNQNSKKKDKKKPAKTLKEKKQAKRDESVRKLLHLSRPPWHELPGLLNSAG